MRLGISLRPQLVLVSLLLLLLPWAGCQSIKEMESALRQGQADTLQATMQAVSATLKYTQNFPNKHNQTPQLGEPLVVDPMTQPMILDGYADEWQQDNTNWREFRGFHKGKEVKLLLKLVTDMKQLYLFFRVFEPEINFYDPQKPENNFDRIWLYGINKQKQFQRWQIRPEAMGAFSLEKTDDSGLVTNKEGNAYLSKRSWGYQIEIKLPLNWARNGLGFRFFSVADKSDDNALLLTTGPSAHSAPLPLILPNQNLSDLLSEYAPQGVELKILNAQGWLLASGNHKSTRRANRKKPGYWLVEKLYNAILSRDELEPWTDPIKDGRWQNLASIEQLPVQSWYRDKLLNRQLQLIPIKLDNGELLILAGTQGSERLLSQAGQVFDRLFLVSLLMILIAGAGLLAYASLLSYRIRHLSQQAESAVSADGQISQTFTASRHPDEIGELSRIISQLLTRQAQYTGYLQSLSSKLSHELRTPLAVVRTSLDNLAHETLNPTIQQYVNRAQDGSARLSSILSSLSMASRLEQALEQSEMEVLDLSDLLKELIPAYQAVYIKQKLELEFEAKENYQIECAPDLIVQLLDKLFDNAADFTPEAGQIKLSINKENDFITLRLFNQGSQLPTSMASQLFDSLVSVRDQKNEKTHLGLGLYIVKLITNHHRGKMSARNKNDGVQFKIQLPVSQTSN